MFENLIAQPAGDLLVDDIVASRLPPSMLFSGKAASGKLSAALELARILSCNEGKAQWTCTCSSCLRHKELSHPDLLIMGPRDCSLEVRAAAAAFLRNRGTASRFLFIRSVRKLVLRFSPALQDPEDSRFSRVVPLLEELDERLEEIAPSRSLGEDAGALAKLVEKIVEAAEKLEEDFLYDSIPVSQVRNASSWAQLSPSGRKKVLIIENADRMQDSARNALLKVLEEPPSDVVFILTSSRRGAILPTILSRVRTYAFVDRSAEAQAQAITRVFHDEPASGEPLEAYFHRFLPVSPETISAVAATFLGMVLVSAIDEGRRPLSGLKTVLDASGARLPPGPLPPVSSLVGLLNKCKPGLVWHLFLGRLAGFMRSSLRTGSVDARETAVYTRWTALIREALDAVDVYNISPAAALEKLLASMKEVV